MLQFRIDDVSKNTNVYDLKKMIKFLNSNFNCEIMLCINPLSYSTKQGSVYPDPPFKDKGKGFFYDVDTAMSSEEILEFAKMKHCNVVSHGLFHADHSDLQYDAQEMSIVGSCNLLNTDTFVPPFNRFNNATESVCRHHGIDLIKSDLEGWKSLEFNKYDPTYLKWYFHAWRFSPKEFEDAFK